MRNMEKNEFNLAQQPLLKKVTDEIYRLSVRFPFGMREMNSYLIQGDHGFTIIDTGSQAQEAIDIWKQTLASGIPIEKVILTHAHPDHIGLSKWFQENYHVPVFISSAGYREIQRTRSNDNAKWVNRVFKKHGGPEIPEQLIVMEAMAYEFEPDELFENHQQIQLGNDMYETIWTPGHCPDHFCFYNAQKQIMIVGDHVLGAISPIVAIWSEADVNPLKDYFSSLEMMKAYPTRIALPGHGKVLENLGQRVNEIQSGHNHRLEQILESVKNEEKTAGQIFQEIYGSVRINRSFAPLMATITRLMYLESIGKVGTEIKNGQIFYQSAQ